MDLKTLKNMVVQAKMDEIKAAARLEVLEGVIADFFRLHLVRDDHEALKAGLEQLSQKLLSMQGAGIEDKAAAARALADMQSGIMEQAQQRLREADAAAQEAVDNGLQDSVEDASPPAELPLEHTSGR